MERLTLEADFGLEDWEETLFFVKGDPNGAYNILDIAKYQGESEFDEILKNVALRLAAYENTGLEPEEVQAVAGLASENCAKTADAIDKLLQDDAELKSYRELGPIDRLRELAQAELEGRCVVMPCKIGDPVWRLYDDCDFPGDCYTKQKCRGCEYRNLFIEEQAFCLSMLCQNGKLAPPYYTIRAEAEAALRREQE